MLLCVMRGESGLEECAAAARAAGGSHAQRGGQGAGAGRLLLPLTRLSHTFVVRI